jgi:hypothetical protein
MSGGEERFGWVPSQATITLVPGALELPDKKTKAESAPKSAETHP